jgi:hypothetical protein
MPLKHVGADDADDTVGSAFRANGGPDIADDTEGNKAMWSDATVKSDVVPVGGAEPAEEPDDTEGNKAMWSDATVKSDVVPVGGAEPAEEPDDTEGNAARGRY